MAQADFCRTVLRQLRAQAGKAARRYSRLRHMLVLPPGEGLLCPPRPGAHPCCFKEPPRTITSFGESQVAGALPPKGCWPVGSPPIRAIVAEQEYEPYRPLAHEPYRIHLFFGCDGWMNTLNGLCNGIMDLAKDVDRALQNCLGSIVWHSNDCIHGDKITILDGWLCTLHWWAWKATDSPIFTQPKVVIGKNAIDCDRMNRAVVERLSFSLIDLDIFTASIAMIDLIDRFFDSPPDLLWNVDYPCVSENVEPAVKEETECNFKAVAVSDDQKPKVVANGALYNETGDEVMPDNHHASEMTVDDSKSVATHSLDFRSVNWYGKSYFFSPNQAAVVKILWESWQQNTPDVGDQTLLETADSNNTRLDHVFRGHEAWGTMIVPGQTKGSRRLIKPVK